MTWYLNESGVYSDPGFILYCSPRKACASTGVCKLDSMVIGQHIYKCVYGLYSLMKAQAHQCGKIINITDMLKIINCSILLKEDTHIKRDIKNALMHNTILPFIINLTTVGPGVYFIHSAAISGVYLSPGMYMSYNTDKYGTYLATYIYIYT